MTITKLSPGLIEPGTIQTVDLGTDVKSNIDSAFAQANSAGIYANAAFAVANTGGGAGTDSWARDAANSASSYANSAFSTANTGGGGTVGTSSARTMGYSLVFGS